MKKLPYLFIVINCIMIVLTSPSCKKDKDDNTEDPIPTDTTGQNQVQDSTRMQFWATIDGTAFQADTNAISHEFDVDLGVHVFTCPNNSGKIVTLMLASLVPGTYDVDFDNSIVLYQNGTTVYSGAFNPQGQIVISKNQNNKISGTFDADLFDFGTGGEASVTDGHFINLQY
jgi:hypothetical protein